MDNFEQITTGNALLIRQSEYDCFLDAVSNYNRQNGNQIAVSLENKNTDTGDMVFKVTAVKKSIMLNDILEIGKLMMMFKMNSNRK